MQSETSGRQSPDQENSIKNRGNIVLYFQNEISENALLVAEVEHLAAHIVRRRHKIILTMG